MPRKPRIEFPNALYHVVARGNHRDRIFLAPIDFRKYLDLIARYKKLHNFKLYAYALMSNHLHLLIETDSVPLSKTMQGLQQTYTQFFNWKYQKVGHLFQGRYKAIICQKDNYLLQLVRYIHLNPIRAGVVEKLSNYLWTSHSRYLHDRKDELVDTDFILAQFDSKKPRALRHYRQFIRDGIEKGHQIEVERVIDRRILGEEDFAERILKHEGLDWIENDGDGQKPELDEILVFVSQSRSIAPQAIKSNVKSRDIVLARRLFIYIARACFGYSLMEIARCLGIDITTITKNVRAFDRQIEREPSFRKNVLSPLLKALDAKCQECQA